MAGFIEFSDSQVWSSANWVYWGLMDHVLNSFVDNPAPAKLVEECKWAQCMAFTLIREDAPELAEGIRERLVGVASQIVNSELPCTVDGRELEEPDQLNFRDEIRRLVEMIREQEFRPA